MNNLDMHEIAAHVNNHSSDELSAIPAAAISARHAAGLKYAAANIAIFACEVGGKRPLPGSAGFKDATTDEATINARWADQDCNLALEPEQAGWCVVDLDGPEGEATWAKLIAEHPTPATRTVKTPHGRHLYFNGSLPPSASKLGPGVDTRGRISYVLVPPSIVDGLPYRELDIGGEQIDLPAWIPERLAAARHTEAVAAVADLDLPVNVERARDRLRALVERGDVAREGEGGNDRTYRLAAELLNLGLSPEYAVEVIGASDWNAACEPPWELEELETIVDHAAKYAQNEAGAWGAGPLAQEWIDYAAQQPAEAPAPETRQKWVFRTPAEDANLPPLTYWDTRRGARDHGMMPRVIGGCSLIVCGEKSSHKTGVVIKECLDAVFSEGARVLYLAAEGAHGIWTARLSAACKERGRSIQELAGKWHTFASSPGLMNVSEIDGLIDACRANGFIPDIIVIDTITRALPGFDINTPATGAGLIVGMERLGATFNALVIGVTHPGKDSAKGSIGSSLIESLAFAIWYIRRDGDAVFATVEKMKDGPAEFATPFKVIWSDRGVPIVADPAPGEALPTTKNDELREVNLRSILAQHEAYGTDNCIFEDDMARHLTGAEPHNGVDNAEEWTRWNTRHEKMKQALRDARKRGGRKWAAGLHGERCREGGTTLAACWFLPENLRPKGAAEPFYDLGQRYTTH
jgi:hypothetical protein